ncbi:hypothetical protein PIB30_079992 [Stylosanthes scabra]|uniref:Uncharacterized protein n=1 Tax=Stylosanthes scabra TaxID=79078 RepID=A0ABU6VPR5_9FABA|nr:hypothetical protein [Stylosanthes scabra]
MENGVMPPSQGVIPPPQDGSIHQVNPIVDDVSTRGDAAVNEFVLLLAFLFHYGLKIVGYDVSKLEPFVFPGRYTWKFEKAKLDKVVEIMMKSFLLKISLSMWRMQRSGRVFLRMQKLPFLSNKVLSLGFDLFSNILETRPAIAAMAWGTETCPKLDFLIAVWFI